MEDSEYAEMLRATMERLATTASNPTSIGLMLRDATHACLDMIDGCRRADILIIDAGAYQSVAATSPLSEELDRAQERSRRAVCQSRSGRDRGAM